MAASTNPNGLRVVLPNAGGGFAVQGTEIASATINADNLAANIITSDYISTDVIQHAVVSLSSANLLAMYATPVVLIAAPGTGKNLLIHKVMFTMTRTATAYAAGGAVGFQLGTTNHLGGTQTTATFADTVLTTAGAATTYTTLIPVSYTGTANAGLYISNDTAAFTTGTGTAVADIWYSVK